MSRGFTLLEILAALALFAVMTLGISATLQQTARVTENVNQRKESVTSAQLAMDRLSSELRMAYRESTSPSDTLFQAREGSNGTEITFSYLDSPIRSLFVNRTPGLKIVRYFLEQNDETGTFDLKRIEAPYFERELLDTTEVQALTAAKGILSFDLEFFDLRNDQWIPEWNDGGSQTGGYFPTAVRINLEAVNSEFPSDEWEDRKIVFATSVMVLNQYEEIR